MARLDKPRLCPNCGTQVALVDALCWRCYQKLPPPPAPEAVPVRPRRRVRIPASTVVVMLLLAGLGGYLWHIRSSPTAAFMAYLRAEESGDVRAMYDLLSLRSRDILSPETAPRQAPQIVGPVSFVVRSVRSDGDSAEIIVVDHAGPGTGAGEAESRVHMVREHGRWRVDMVATGRADTEDWISPRQWIIMRQQSAARR